MAFQLPLTLSMPTPHEWMQLYVAMDIARTRRDPKGIPEPPFPLILGGTMCSGGSTIFRRWVGLIAWANTHGFAHQMARRLPHRLKEEIVRGNRPTPPTQPVATRTDPNVNAAMHRPVTPETALVSSYWYRDNRPKKMPSRDEVIATRQRLCDNWEVIAGPMFWGKSWPWRFSGRKRRKLTIHLHPQFKEPRGGLDARPSNPVHPEVAAFRSRLANAIQPMEVDVLSFTYRSCSPCRSHRYKDYGQ